MMYAIINDNMVKEIREITSEEELSYISGISQFAIPAESFPRYPKVGWVFLKGECYPDIPDITPRQARQAIAINGYSIEYIEGVISSLPEPSRSLALIEWEYSTAFIRRNPLVSQIGAVLGLTEDELDDLWIFGSKL